MTYVTLMRWSFAGIMALLAVSSGCAPDDQIPVYAVQGKILLSGQPMQGGGSIAFVPIDGQIGKTAGGTIEADGSYSLTTYDVGDGSRAGEFRVVIDQVTVQEPDAAPEEGPVGAIGKTVPREKHIAAKYSNYEKSPLTATVKEVSTNEIDFQLERK